MRTDGPPLLLLKEKIEALSGLPQKDLILKLDIAGAAAC